MGNYKIGDVICAKNCYADYIVGKLLEIKDDRLIIDSSWNFNSNVVDFLNYGVAYDITVCKKVTKMYKIIIKIAYRIIMNIDLLRYSITKKIVNKSFEIVLEWLYDKNKIIYSR